MLVSRLAAVAASVIIGAAALSGPGMAYADPINSRNAFGPFPIECDNGTTYQAVITGNQEFTHAHILNSTGILIPTTFGPFHAVVTDLQGEIVDEFTDPPQAKGNATKGRATSTSCS